uniref:uncharacterized protein LOC100181947 n=1 Tax=Ciona intestinalis TaxID=7719 RepID=UPI000EF52481|nr:uncharacterized protein LOC100181947 [Ciona intestinalis]|eukprot:XP_026689372.1 uncharacterized protein LOC100181947 [Ciona intestinalis]
MFYDNPSMENLYNRKLRIASWGVFVLAILCFLIQAVLTLLGSKYQVKNKPPGVCYEQERWLSESQIILGAAASAVTHSCLLALFVYPLLRHRLETLSVLHRSNADPAAVPSLTPRTLRKEFQNSFKRHASIGATSNRGRKNERRLPLLIRRCVILTSICVMVNIAATVLTATLYKSENKLATVLYGANLLVNLSCSVGFFRQWRQIIFPPSVRCRNPEEDVSMDATRNSIDSRSEYAKIRISRKITNSSDVRV